jgi:hypothetical protein
MASTLVTIELRFTTDEDPGQLADRVRESTRLIVGGQSLEEFRWRSMPLDAKGGRPPSGGAQHRS